MQNPRKFSEKIALHHQKQKDETAAFEQIMREVSDATQKVNSSKLARVKLPPEPSGNVDSTLRPAQQGLGTFRSGSLPNVAAPQATVNEPEQTKPEEISLVNQYGMGGLSGSTSPSRSPGQRGRTSSSVGPMRRPADRKHDTSPYGSTVYLSPPPDSNWRRTNSDSALNQSCGVEQSAVAQPLSPQRLMQTHPHPHLHPLQNHHRRGDIHQDMLSSMHQTNRPRSSCEIPRLPNNNNVYKSGGDGGGGGGGGVAGGGGGGGGGGGLACGELQVPGGSLPDLTSVHFPPPHWTSSDYQPRYSPTSPGAVSPGGGSASPATGGLSPASGSPVGATVPAHHHLHHHDLAPALYDAQNHLSVPNTNNYSGHNKNMSPLDYGWISSGYSPPSQYSSTTNINIPSPTVTHSPTSPVESPQNDYNNSPQALLQPFEQITMLDQPVSNYNTSYMNQNSPQTTNSPLSYTQCTQPASGLGGSCRRARDPVAGGFPLASPSAPPTPATPASIPDIVLTDYSGELELEAGMFCSEEARLRAGLDLEELTLLEDPAALVPDSAVEHEFRLDRFDRLDRLDRL